MGLLMTMIEAMSLREFRGIKECKKPLRFSKFNVLIGRNNSGKTAILEALFLFPIPFDAYFVPLFGRPKTNIIRLLHWSEASLVYGYSGSAEINIWLKGVDKIIKYIVNDRGNVRIFINGKEMNASDSFKFFSEILKVNEKNLMNFSFFYSK